EPASVPNVGQNFLPIQGSSVPCERIFSSAGLTGTDRRNRLNSVTFEALQVLKAGYKSGLVITNVEEPENFRGEVGDGEMDLLVAYVGGKVQGPKRG
ncbi:hypothetical protein FRC02_004590, partial [Tulasnella sp. 418]